MCMCVCVCIKEIEIIVCECVLVCEIKRVYVCLRLNHTVCIMYLDTLNLVKFAFGGKVLGSS